MARRKAIQRKLQKQRRYAVDEIRLREMTRDAKRRVSITSGDPMENLFGSTEEAEKKRDNTYFKAVDLFRRQVKDLMGVMPSELPSKLNKRTRFLLGLEGTELEGNDLDLKTPRDLVMHKLKIMMENTNLVFRVGRKALYLIRTESRYWYFLYREEGSYYKKSVLYDSRTKAMDRYENEKISWIAFFDESSGNKA